MAKQEFYLAQELLLGKYQAAPTTALALHRQSQEVKHPISVCIYSTDEIINILDFKLVICRGQLRCKQCKGKSVPCLLMQE